MKTVIIQTDIAKEREKIAPAPNPPDTRAPAYTDYYGRLKRAQESLHQNIPKTPK